MTRCRNGNSPVTVLFCLIVISIAQYKQIFNVYPLYTHKPEELFTLSSVDQDSDLPATKISHYCGVFVLVTILSMLAFVQPFTKTLRIKPFRHKLKLTLIRWFKSNFGPLF